MTNYAKLNLLFFFSFTVPAAMQAIKHRQRKAIKHRQRKKKIGEKKNWKRKKKTHVHKNYYHPQNAHFTLLDYFYNFFFFKKQTHTITPFKIHCNFYGRKEQVILHIIHSLK